MLGRGQAFVQVVRLKDETQPATVRNQIPLNAPKSLRPSMLPFWTSRRQPASVSNLIFPDPDGKHPR